MTSKEYLTLTLEIDVLDRGKVEQLSRSWDAPVGASSASSSDRPDQESHLNQAVFTLIAEAFLAAQPTSGMHLQGTWVVE